MKRIFITILITITSILAYCQSNVPVSLDNKCLERNDEKLSRAMIATFGIDTVKMWIDKKQRFICLIRLDSLGYVKKHFAVIRFGDWFGEYRRKKLEKYLIQNKIKFEFCFDADGWKNLNTAVLVMQRDVRSGYEKRGYNEIMSFFPGEFTRVPLPLPPDYKEYEKLSPFEIFCKRLNIKIDN